MAPLNIGIAMLVVSTVVSVAACVVATVTKPRKSYLVPKSVKGCSMYRSFDKATPGGDYSATCVVKVDGEGKVVTVEEVD